VPLRGPIYFLCPCKGRQRSALPQTHVWSTRPEAARLRCAQVRFGARDFPRGHPVPSENAAHPCAAPCGSCPRPSAVPRRDLKVQSRSNRNSRSRSALAFALVLASAVALPPPLKSGGGRRVKPEGRRAGRASFLEGTWMSLPKIPGGRSGLFAQRKADRRGVLSLAYLPLHKQRKVGRAAKRHESLCRRSNKNGKPQGFPFQSQAASRLTPNPPAATPTTAHRRSPPPPGW
jgi:hypothetical protein